MVLMVLMVFMVELCLRKIQIKRASAVLVRQSGVANTALPGRRRSAPSGGGSAVHEVTSVGALYSLA